jgi:RNA polymerase sigma-70 factor (ECF subfamily)
VLGKAHPATLHLIDTSTASAPAEDRAIESSNVEAAAAERDQSEKVLVDQAKEYLHQRLSKMAPDAVLTLAWEVFYQTYTDVLRRMAAEFHLDKQESEDLVQEVWARVIVNLSKFQWAEHGAGLRGWLYTMIRNQALNLFRQKVRRPVKLADGAVLREVADPGPGPAEQWEACWDRELLHHVIEELAKKVSPENHRLMILRWLEERSLAETAALLNLTEKQVTYRQHRLFRKLRAALAVYRGEPFGESQSPCPE